MRAVVIAYNKFRSYIIDSKVIVYMDLAAIQHLLLKRMPNFF